MQTTTLWSCIPCILIVYGTSIRPEMISVRFEGVLYTDHIGMVISFHKWGNPFIDCKILYPFQKEPQQGILYFGKP